MIDLTWFRWGDTELANGVRTLAYLDAARRAGAWSDGFCAPECVLARCCQTEVVGGPFTTPSGEGIASELDTIPAPWYDGTYLPSGEYLGMMVTSVDGLDGTTSTRDVVDGTAKGGTLTRRRQPARRITIRATLLATSCEGMAYGQRWLGRLLTPCVNCDTDTSSLAFLAACPTGECPSQDVRVAPRVGLAKGPTYTPIDQSGDCRCVAQDVTIDLIAESPYLFSYPVDLYCSLHECAGGLIAVGDVATRFPGDASPSESAPPESLSAPIVSGGTEEGDELSVTDGTWSGDTPIDFEYQWERL